MHLTLAKLGRVDANRIAGDSLGFLLRNFFRRGFFHRFNRSRRFRFFGNRRLLRSFFCRVEADALFRQGFEFLLIGRVVELIHDILQRKLLEFLFIHGYPSLLAQPLPHRFIQQDRSRAGRIE